MTKRISHLALNSLPTVAPEAGSIVFLSNGSQYVTTTNGTYIKISDLVFTDTLEQFGTLEKLYVHTENGKAKLKVWNGLEYIDVGGGQNFDTTQLEADIAQLQSDLVALQDKFITAESKITSNEGKISTLDGKVTTLETELDNLDLAIIEANILSNTNSITTITTKVTDLETDITTLESDMDNVDAKLLALETKITELESAEVDLTPIQTQLDAVVSNATTNTIDITTLNGKVSTLETEVANIESGQDGLSAYQIAVNNGFIGTEVEWLESLKGQNGTDGINGINGSDAEVTSENIETALGYKPASTASFNVTIGTNWVGSVAPYTQTVSVNGILSTDSPFAYPIYSSDNATAINEEDTWSKIGKITTNANNVTITCFEEKPTTALTIQLKVVR